MNLGRTRWDKIFLRECEWERSGVSLFVCKLLRSDDSERSVVGDIKKEETFV